MKILKRAANVFSLIFFGFCCSYGDISVNALKLWRLQGENMHTNNFILRWLTWLIWNWFLRTRFFIICSDNEVMENPIPKLSQTSIISKKPGFLFDKLKTLTSSNCNRVLYFSLKFCTRFLLSNVYKRVCGVF